MSIMVTKKYTIFLDFFICLVSVQNIKEGILKGVCMCVKGWGVSVNVLPGEGGCINE